MQLVAAAAWLLTINAVAFAAFALDKRRAVMGGWRVPERVLLQLAAAGGSPAALAALPLLRHKTRKQPFAARLWGIVLVQALALGALSVFAR